LVLSNILEFNVDGEEWDDSEENVNLDEVLSPNNEESISKEPLCLGHSSDKHDCTSPRREPKEEVYKVGC